MYKQHYSHFLSINPERLHFAAHSHHLWLDVTRDAHLRYWDDSARLIDEKWSYIFDTVMPKVQQSIAAMIGCSRPQDICFAPNTHSLVVRLLSCFDYTKPLKILTTDSEFHSFSRQIKRFEELENVCVTRIPSCPASNFTERFIESLNSSAYDLVFLSQVFFNTGAVLPNLEYIVRAVQEPKTLIVIDGYHAFFALPVDLRAVEKRIFYLAGGYKYAQAGEGVCFMSLPEGCALRPLDTGWFASFDDLEQVNANCKEVSYSNTGFRFSGATFDPSGLYRLNAVFDWMMANNLSITTIHNYVQSLQRYFLSSLARHPSSLLPIKSLANQSLDYQGHFLIFDLPNAKEVHEFLGKREIVVDRRGQSLRVGFGLYQDSTDIDRLMQRIND